MTDQEEEKVAVEEEEKKAKKSKKKAKKDEKASWFALDALESDADAVLASLVKSVDEAVAKGVKMDSSSCMNSGR